MGTGRDLESFTNEHNRTLHEPSPGSKTEDLIVLSPLLKGKRKRRNLSPSPEIKSKAKRRNETNFDRSISDFTPPRTPTEEELSRIMATGPDGNATFSLDHNCTIDTDEPDEPISGSTLLENSLLQYDEASILAEQEDEELYQVAFLPCDEKPLIEHISSIVNDNIVEDSSKSTKITVMEHLSKSALEEVMNYLGTPLSVMDILLAPGCLVFSDLGIDSQDKLRDWQVKNAKRSILIKESVQAISKGQDLKLKDIPQKSMWLTCCHVLASVGAEILGHLNKAGLDIINKMVDKEQRNTEIRNLHYTVSKLRELAVIYASARRLSELFFCDPKDIVFFVPRCCSLLLWTIVKEKTVDKFFPSSLPTVINQVPNMVEHRLKELGVRTHSNARTGRKIIGTASNFSCSPADRPIVGQTKEIAPQKTRQI